MSSSRSDAFAELASQFAAACADAVESNDVLAVPDESIGQAMASLVRLYAAKAQAGHLPPVFGRNSALAVTDAAIACTAMMEAADISLFDLGAWQSMAGVGRRIAPADHRGNVNDGPPPRRTT